MSNTSPASQAEATSALKALFTAFPAERGNGIGGAATYLMAVEGYSLPAIQKAVSRLIRGEFDWFGGRFLPTTAELSRACRYCEDLIAPPQRLALPAPGSEALTEGEVTRRQAMAERAKAMFPAPGTRREPVPTPAEEFDAWEKREQERIRAEGLPKLSPHLVADAKTKLADAKRVAEALIAAEEAAEARRQRLAKQGDFAKVTLPTQPRTGKERDAA